MSSAINRLCLDGILVAEFGTFVTLDPNAEIPAFVHGFTADSFPGLHAVVLDDSAVGAVQLASMFRRHGQNLTARSFILLDPARAASFTAADLQDVADRSGIYADYVDTTQNPQHFAELLNDPGFTALDARHQPIAPDKAVGIRATPAVHLINRRPLESWAPDSITTTYPAMKGQIRPAGNRIQIGLPAKTVNQRHANLKPRERSTAPENPLRVGDATEMLTLLTRMSVGERATIIADTEHREAIRDGDGVAVLHFDNGVATAADLPAGATLQVLIGTADPAQTLAPTTAGRDGRVAALAIPLSEIPLLITGHNQVHQLLATMNTGDQATITTANANATHQYRAAKNRDGVTIQPRDNDTPQQLPTTGTFHLTLPRLGPITTEQQLTNLRTRAEILLAQRHPNDLNTQYCLTALDTIRELTTPNRSTTNTATDDNHLGASPWHGALAPHNWPRIPTIDDITARLALKPGTLAFVAMGRPAELHGFNGIGHGFFAVRVAGKAVEDTIRWIEPGDRNTPMKILTTAQMREHLTSTGMTEADLRWQTYEPHSTTRTNLHHTPQSESPARSILEYSDKRYGMFPYRNAGIADGSSNIVPVVDPQSRDQNPPFAVNASDVRLATDTFGAPDFVLSPSARPVDSTKLSWSSDGTLAINAAEEAKEFYAATDRISAANADLAEAGSPLQLVAGGYWLTSPQGERLVVVRPQLRSVPTALEEFLVLDADECIEVSERLLGPQIAAVFRQPNGNAVMTETGVAGSDLPALAATLAGGGPPRTAAEAAYAVRGNQPSMSDGPGRRYGTKLGQNDPALDASAVAIGVNRYARARVGEVLSTHSIQNPVVGDQLDRRDYSRGGRVPAEHGIRVWVYHYGAVVMASRDGRDQVTLENFNRLQEARTGMVERAIELISERYAAELQDVIIDPRANPGARLAARLAALHQTNPAYWTEAAQKAEGQVNRLIRDAKWAMGEKWYFKMYRPGTATSFHDEAKISMINPLTVVSTRQYVLDFTSEEATLNTIHRHKLRDFAGANAGGTMNFVVKGYARGGLMPFQQLARKRAEVVRDEMVRLGIPASRLYVDWQSRSDAGLVTISRADRPTIVDRRRDDSSVPPVGAWTTPTPQATRPTVQRSAAGSSTAVQPAGYVRVGRVTYFQRPDMSWQVSDGNGGWGWSGPPPGYGGGYTVGMAQVPEIDLPADASAGFEGIARRPRAIDADVSMPGVAVPRGVLVNPTSVPSSSFWRTLQGLSTRSSGLSDTAGVAEVQAELRSWVTELQAAEPALASVLNADLNSDYAHTTMPSLDVAMNPVGINARWLWDRLLRSLQGMADSDLGGDAELARSAFVAATADISLTLQRADLVARALGPAEANAEQVQAKIADQPNTAAEQVRPRPQWVDATLQQLATTDSSTPNLHLITSSAVDSRTPSKFQALITKSISALDNTRQAFIAVERGRAGLNRADLNRAAQAAHMFAASGSQAPVLVLDGFLPAHLRDELAALGISVPIVHLVKDGLASFKWQITDLGKPTTETSTEKLTDLNAYLLNEAAKRAGNADNSKVKRVPEQIGPWYFAGTRAGRRAAPKPDYASATNREFIEHAAQARTTDSTAQLAKQEFDFSVTEKSAAFFDKFIDGSDSVRNGTPLELDARIDALREILPDLVAEKMGGLTTANVIKLYESDALDLSSRSGDKLADNAKFVRDFVGVIESVADGTYKTVDNFIDRFKSANHERFHGNVELKQRFVDVVTDFAGQHPNLEADQRFRLQQVQNKIMDCR